MAALFRLLYRVELSDEGLEIWWLRRQVVPWHHIDSVTTVNRWGGQHVAVHDANQNRSRALPASSGGLVSAR